MKRKILKNRGMCLKCGQTVESVNVHDFAECRCGAIAVDGGHEYLRRLGEGKDFREMSVIQFDDGKVKDYSETA